jgi:hypothetical protein
MRLPVIDVAYASPHGNALGVIVRSSVDAAAESPLASAPDSEPPPSGVVEHEADSRVAR